MNKVSIWDRDNSYLLFILAVSSLFIYFTPPGISRVAYLLLLIPVAYSRKDYVWLAFLFILLETPNYLYYGGTRDDPTRIPIYTFGEGISFGFQDILMIVLLTKNIKNDLGPFRKFRYEMIGISAIFMISLLVGIIIGMKFSNYSQTIRFMMPLIYIIMIPKTMKKPEDWLHFLKLIFPVVIFTFIGQIYFIIKKEPLSSLIFPDMIQKVNMNFLVYLRDSQVSRYITGPYIGYICFCAALYYLTYKNPVFNASYLKLIVTLSFLQPILSATRSHSIVFLFIFLGWILSQKVTKLPKILLLIIIILLVGIHQINRSTVVKSQIDKSYERLMTVTNIVKGDMTAGGTYSRLTTHTTSVMKKYIESPLFGFGFSDEFFQNSDDHVGVPNMLLNIGMIGFVLFSAIILSIIKKILKIDKKKRLSMEKKLFLLGVIGIIWIHIFGRQLFGFCLASDVQFFIIVFFSFWITITANVKTSKVI